MMSKRATGCCSGTPYLFAVLLGLLLMTAIIFAPAAPAQSPANAKRLFDDAQYAEAKVELPELQKVGNRSAEVAYRLGRTAMASNDTDEAIRQFERAVALEDDNADYHFWLGSAIRDAMPRVNKVNVPSRVLQMKTEFERAVELDPDHIDARFYLVQLYAIAPAAIGGSMAKARAQAAEIDRRNQMRGALARGIIAEQAQDAAAEEVAYRQAIAAAPDNPAGYFALANLYVREGNVADAFATLDGYIQHHPRDAWALYHAGRLAATTGEQLDRGEKALNQFLAAPPSNASAAIIAAAHYRLGQIAERRGAKDAAREQYRTALTINPKSRLPQRALDTLK